MTKPEPRLSVLIVEDEAMIRMMVADMLEDLGYAVAGEAGSIEEAVQLARSAQFDIALLDVNLNGKSIEPVADVIEGRKLPLIFASGYGANGLPEKFRDRPALQKPFQMETLGNMLETVLGKKAA
jgi:CheY-like chemotaxis protein